MSNSFDLFPRRIASSFQARTLAPTVISTSTTEGPGVSFVAVFLTSSVQTCPVGVFVMFKDKAGVLYELLQFGAA